MKMIRRILVLVTLLIVSAVSANAYRYGGSGGMGPGNGSDLLLLPGGDLSPEEEAALLYMREEEKLARDVYLAIYEQTGLVIFENIAQSEQRHMDSVKQLLDKYGLEDPAVDDTPGVFTNQELASLYQELVSRGSSSEIEALKVGALIEDLDIHDLDENLSLTDQEDIRTLFERLREGSYNHLRAFVNALAAYGEGYEPEYVSYEEFEQIVGSQEDTSNINFMPIIERRYRAEERRMFIFTPSLIVRSEYQGNMAELYAVVYHRETGQWYLVTGENQLVLWNPGDDLIPFAQVTLGDTITFPIIVQPIDLSGLEGTFDVYVGYQPQNGPMVYTLRSLYFE